MIGLATHPTDSSRRSTIGVSESAARQEHACLSELAIATRRSSLASVRVTYARNQRAPVLPFPSLFSSIYPLELSSAIISLSCLLLALDLLQVRRYSSSSSSSSSRSSSSKTTHKTSWTLHGYSCSLIAYLLCFYSTVPHNSFLLSAFTQCRYGTHSQIPKAGDRSNPCNPNNIIRKAMVAVLCSSVIEKTM